MEDAPQPVTPEKPWPPWARPYLAALRRVPSISRAADEAGIDRRTVYRLAQRSESFAVAQHDAREAALDTLEGLIFARATTGTPERKVVTKTLADGSVERTETEERHVSDTLAMFYLKRWRPEYRENYTVTHAGDVNVKLDVEALDRDIGRILEDLGSGG